MNSNITYEQIHPLVQYVEIVSDVVQCHFHCPVKSKKIVAITRFSKFTREEAPEIKSISGRIKYSVLQNYNKYFGTYSAPLEIEEHPFQKENAIVHAFEKISERFIWSIEHNHFVYRF